MTHEGTAQVVRGLPHFEDVNLVVGAEAFSDAGVYRLEDNLLIVQSLDFFPPLVDDPFVFGQIAAANSMSDIYAMGGSPRTALNIVGFPDDRLELEVLSEILRGGAERVKHAGAVIVGGHSVRDSEIKYGLSVTGIVTPDRLVTNRGARPGDVLVLTKPIGTGFVTTAFKAGACPDEVLAAAVQSMIQLNDLGASAAAEVRSHAATDVTGFGLAGHATELAQASRVTVCIELGRIPLLPGAETLVQQGYHTRAIKTNRSFVEPRMRVEGSPAAARFSFAFEAETSGGLLLSVAADRASNLVDRLRSLGAASAAVIGEVLARQDVAIILRA